MKVLLVASSRIVRDMFISELIPRGINFLWCDNISEALSKMKEGKISCDVLVLESLSKYDTVSFVSMFRTLNPRPILVLYTELHSKDEVYEYLKLGVSGFLQKPLDPKNIFPVVFKAYEHSKGAPPERQVVRVQLEEGEGSVEFVSSSGVRVIGNILDISVGGFAFSYISKYDNAFSQGETVDKVRLILKEEEVFVKGLIKLKDESSRKAIIVFSEINLDAIRKISKFIFLKISS
ncbi:MAG: response regulator [Brevinematia bacterium]